MTQPLPPRSRFQRIKDWIDPRIKTEGAQLKHWIATTSLGLVFGLIAAFWLAFGAFWVGTKTVSWYQQVTTARKAFHPKTGVVVPAAPPVKIIVAGGSGLPHSGGINFDFFTGTDMQGDRSTTTCEAHVVSKAESYDLNRRNKTHITISPRLNFDDVTGGKMIATAPQWYIAIARDHGLVRNKHFSYGPHQIPSSFPPYSAEGSPLFVNPYRRKVPINETFLWGSPAPGAGAITKLKQQIGLHQQPVLITMPMYGNAEAAAWYTGHITTHAAGDYLDFYHGVICTRYQDNRVYNGERGWVLCNNSWGPLFGVDQYGNINYGHGGYFWYSYKAIETESLQGLIVTLVKSGRVTNPGGGPLSPKDQPATNPNAPTHPAPFNPGTPAGGGTFSPYVHGVVLHDTGVDITNLINFWVSYYHRNGVYEVSGPGLVATGLTESSLNQYAPRCCIPGDTSYGLMQFTLGTACAYGICSNIEANLNNPAVAVRLAAEYYDNAYHQHPNVGMPFAYNFFNSGTGISDSYAYAPQGVAWANFQHFLGNWNTSLAYYMGGAPAPAPVVKKVALVFHVRSWCRSYLAWRIKGCPSAYWHGHLGAVPRFWAFSKGLNAKAGGVAAHEVWHPKRRYMLQRFTHAVIYSWPTKKGSRPKVVLR